MMQARNIPIERPQGSIVVAGVGACTSVGLNALQSTMGIRAEVYRPVETEFIDPKGEPVGMCCVGGLHSALRGAERLVAMAARPLQEAARDRIRTETARRGAAGPIPLVVAVPPGVVEYSLVRKASRFLEAIEVAAPGIVDLERSVEVVGGRAAGVEAFVKALELLATPGVEAVIVGGVDSCYDADRLDALALDFRLHGLETENGICPGEAAAFVLLTHRGRSSALTRYASILGHALTLEPRPFGSDEPCQGLGMTAALGLAAASVGKTRRIGWQITDVMDERHRVDEWEYAWARSFELFTVDVLHERPLTTVGEIGAAAAALLVVEASVRWHTGCGLADMALLAVHSDGSERGAMLLASEGT